LSLRCCSVSRVTAGRVAEVATNFVEVQVRDVLLLIRLLDCRKVAHFPVRKGVTHCGSELFRLVGES